MEKKNNKPIHFLILKIFGFIGIICAIFGIVLLVKGFGDFESNNFMIGSFMSTIGLFAGLSCLFAGFKPEFERIRIKSQKYIQDLNKEDLADISTTNAEISEEALSKTASAIKKGLKDTKFCKDCGKEIVKDAKFCNFCGKEQ